MPVAVAGGLCGGMVQMDEAIERERSVRPPLQRCDVILRDLPADVTEQVPPTVPYRTITPYTLVLCFTLLFLLPV